MRLRPTSRYEWLAFASGAAWGVLALAITLLFDLNHVPWLGIVFSPVIGLVLGRLSCRFFHRSAFVRLLFSFSTVLIATFMFGFISGFGTYWRADFPESFPLYLFISTYMYALGIAITPFLWSLFALAVINHVWLSRKYIEEHCPVPAAS